MPPGSSDVGPFLETSSLNWTSFASQQFYKLEASIAAAAVSFKALRKGFFKMVLALPRL